MEVQMSQTEQHLCSVQCHWPESTLDSHGLQKIESLLTIDQAEHHFDKESDTDADPIDHSEAEHHQKHPKECCEMVQQSEVLASI